MLTSSFNPGQRQVISVVCIMLPDVSVAGDRYVDGCPDVDWPTIFIKTNEKQEDITYEKKNM